MQLQARIMIHIIFFCQGREKFGLFLYQNCVFLRYIKETQTGKYIIGECFLIFKKHYLLVAN